MMVATILVLLMQILNVPLPHEIDYFLCQPTPVITIKSTKVTVSFTLEYSGTY